MQNAKIQKYKNTKIQKQSIRINTVKKKPPVDNRRFFENLFQARMLISLLGSPVAEVGPKIEEKEKAL